MFWSSRRLCPLSLANLFRPRLANRTLFPLSTLLVYQSNSSEPFSMKFRTQRLPLSDQINDSTLALTVARSFASRLLLEHWILSAGWNLWYPNGDRSLAWHLIQCKQLTTRIFTFTSPIPFSSMATYRAHLAIQSMGRSAEQGMSK